MSSDNNIAGSLSANRLPPPATEAEREYRHAQKIIAAAGMLRRGAADLVVVLGLDEVLSEERLAGLRKLTAGQGGEVR